MNRYDSTTTGKPLIPLPTTGVENRTMYNAQLDRIEKRVDANHALIDRALAIIEGLESNVYNDGYAQGYDDAQADNRDSIEQAYDSGWRDGYDYRRLTTNAQ